MSKCLLCRKLQIYDEKTVFNEVYCFPADHFAVKPWRTYFLNKNILEDLDFINICELHFRSEDIIRDVSGLHLKESRLKNDAVPCYVSLKEIFEVDKITDLNDFERNVNLYGWTLGVGSDFLTFTSEKGFISINASLEVSSTIETIHIITQWSMLRGLMKKIEGDQDQSCPRDVLNCENRFYKIQQDTLCSEIIRSSGWKIDSTLEKLLIYKISLDPLPRISSSILIDNNLEAKIYVDDTLSEVTDVQSVDDIIEKMGKPEISCTEFDCSYMENVEVKPEITENFIKDESPLHGEENGHQKNTPKRPHMNLTRLGKPRCDKRGIRALRTCDHCGFTCFYVRDMTNHMKSNHVQAEIACCGKLWNTFRYRVHNRTVHDKDKCCELCGQRFGYNNYLRVHMSEVHGKKGEFICKHCSKDFPINSQLKNHLVEVHGENMSKILCDICGDSFLALHALVTHKKFTHRIGSVPKVRSNKNKQKNDHQIKVPRRQRFSRVGHTNAELPLKLNEQVVSNSHHPERPFKCELCSLSYNSDVHLKRHINRIHDVNARKYECSLCPKAFLTNYELNIHIRDTHNHVEKKQCPLCNQKYNTKSGMRKHLTWGHTNSHYRCECGQLTKQVNTLKHHLKKMHDIVATTKILVAMKVPDDKGIKEMLEVFKNLYKE